MAVDSLWSSVTLLLPCSSDLLDVKGHTVTVNGGAALSSAQAPAGCTSSIALDGNNDYLVVSSPLDALGAGDWAIEIPVYRSGDTVSGTGNAASILDFRTSDTQAAIQIYLYGSTSAQPNKVAVYINGADRIVSSTALSSSFKLITLAKVSGTLRLFFDGVQEGSSYTDSNTYSTTSLTIGGRYAGLSGDFRSLNGYIGPIRITFGNGRGYSSAFSPPSLPFPRPTISGVVLNSSAAAVAKTVLVTDRSSQRLVGGAISSATTGAYLFHPSDFGEYEVKRLDEVCDPFWNWRTLFMPMDGADSSTTGIVDSCGHVVTLVGNTQLKTAQSITGGSSCYFDGTGDRITFAASADWDMSGGNFCIEFCIRANALPSAGNFYRPIAIGPNGSTAGLQVYIMDNGIIGCGTPTAGNVNVFSSAGAIAANTWARIEISCVNGSAMIFKDGAVIAGPTVITAPVSSSSNALVIGYDAAAGVQFPGYIDRIRIGRVAGHTAAFTSNDNAFPAGPADGGSGENALIYDRVIPG